MYWSKYGIWESSSTVNCIFIIQKTWMISTCFLHSHMTLKYFSSYMWSKVISIIITLSLCKTKITCYKNTMKCVLLNWSACGFIVKYIVHVLIFQTSRLIILANAELVLPPTLYSIIKWQGRWFSDNTCY